MIEKVKYINGTEEVHYIHIYLGQGEERTIAGKTKEYPYFIDKSS